MSEQADFSLDTYDFVDFGCSSGGSMSFAKTKLGGVRGLGLDIDQAKVAASRSAGFDAEIADVSLLDPDRLGTVRFVVLSHFLEHLPSLELAEKCIRSAVSIADEFVFIRQPFFDADDSLGKSGLKLYWSDWHGHRNHMKVAQFTRIFDDLVATKAIRRYFIFGRTPITHSDDPCVHPLSSPIDQHGWDAQRHGEKPSLAFDMPVFREIGAVVQTRAAKLVEPPRRFLLSCSVLAQG